MPTHPPLPPLLLFLGLASGAVALLPSPTRAEDCRLALVLALDVSSSVNAYEDRLQREGLARALLAPEVVRAFLSGGPVALYVFEWSGPAHQVMLSPGWQMVEGVMDLERIAASLVADPRRDADLIARTTAVGSALGRAALALDEEPGCSARTVDIAGDGVSNDGDELAVIHAWPQLKGVTVNALIIGGDQLREAQPDWNADLVAWFEAEVLRGPGAFHVVADGYPDYERAMRVKLTRELELSLVSGTPLTQNGT